MPVVTTTGTDTVTTYSNGRVKTVKTDGTVVTQYPYGGTATDYPDGTHEWSSDDYWSKHSPDGSYESKWKQDDGKWVTSKGNKDGGETNYPDGSKDKWGPGFWRKLDTDGTILEEHTWDVCTSCTAAK
jgi:hypothetical protein